MDYMKNDEFTFTAQIFVDLFIWIFGNKIGIKVNCLISGD